ncbi:MAG TPA: TerB family tellurite resistance protein [Polyangia bacterium]|nr:TerB family tellurite resistance protein [Polyangia bacterium]
MSERVQICKVVAQAILADGQLTDAERELLTKLMDRYELDGEQRKEVLARNIGDDAAMLAEGISGFETKNELLVELAMAVAADGRLSPAERQLVSSVAAAIGVEAAEVDMLVTTALG